MAQPAADRNLLFGLLALQMNFIDREQLRAAMQAWVFDKQATLGDILSGQQALTADQRAKLDALVREHLAKHDNDAAKSLAAVGDAEIRQKLESITDINVQASLAHVAPLSATEFDPYATVVPEGPSRTGSANEKPSPLPAGLLPPGAMRFRLVRPHAKGGLGEVFVALDEELHREVALKEIQDRQADNPDSRTRFMLEAEITGGLEHPGIVPVYGLGAYPDGRPYYAMRFIRGDSLKDAIERFHQASAAGLSAGERALELRSLLGRFVDVCNAIAYAHSRDILHRDLKPANIMLGKFGETLVVDWGLAKPIDQPEKTAATAPGEGSLMPMSMNSASKTLLGAAVGTPQYMSPEQAAGQLDQLGPGTDVYSLGATLYCLLAGQAPITDGDIRKVMQRVQLGDFPTPRAVKPDIDPALEAVCLKAMKLRATDRYPTARLLADDIEHWLADEPVSAWTEPWTRRTRRWIGRHATLVTGVASAVAVALVGLILTTVLLTAANERERRAKQQALDNFKLARDAVDHYHTKVSEDDLLHEKGMAPLRKKLLEAAEEFYQKFVDKHAGDPALQGELGKATFRLAQITGDIGSKPEAIKLHEKAAMLFETLPKNQASPEYTSDQAACYHHLGRLYRLSDDIAKSDAYYAKALALWTPLAENNPHEARYHAGLARTSMGIGNAQQYARRLDQAQASYEKSLKEWTALARANPLTFEYQRELAVNQNNLAMIFQTIAGKEKDAESALRAAQATQKKLADEAPNISKYQDDLAATSFNLARSLLATDGPASDADSFLLEAADRWQTLVNQHPTVTRYQTRLAEAHMTLADLFRANNDWPKAETHCQQALKIQRKLLAKFKDETSYQSDLARGLYTLAQICAADTQTDRTKQAETAFDEALGIQEKLASVQTAPHYQRDLAKSYDALGLMHMQKQRGEKANDAFKKSAAWWQKLVKAHPGEQEYAIGLSSTYFNLGNLAKASAKLKDAEPWFTLAVECFDVKNTNLLANAHVRTSLSNAYWWRADTRTQLGQLDAGLQDWDSALTYAPAVNKSSIRLPRAAALARAGKHVEAVKEANELVGRVSAKDGVTLFRFARVYALAATAVKNGEAPTDEYAAQAIKLLGAANDAGYFNSLAEQTKLKTDPALRILRERPEFKKLTSELKLQ